jgi:RNA polymerase sigma-70 factor (ECF subfamily)
VEGAFVRRRSSEDARHWTAAELANAIADGDAVAETALVSKYSAGLFYILRRETRDGATAEDLCQETFRVVLERLRRRRLTDPDKLPSFIIGVGRRLLLAHRRVSARLSAGPDAVDEVEADTATPLEDIVRTEQRQLLASAIERLPTPRDRELLTRYYLMEQDKEEICKALRLEREQFTKAISRARVRLRRLFAAMTPRLVR